MFKEYRDLRDYRIMYITLCIAMMPLIADGYAMYILICLFPYTLKYKFTKDSWLVVLFSICYTLSFFLRGEELPLSKLVFYLIFPIIMYSCGNILGAKLSSSRTIMIVIVSLVFCLAAPGIYFGISDIIGSGELIKINRAIEFADGQTLSATGYGMMFSLSIAGLGMIMIPVTNKFDKKLKYFLIVLSLFAILCTIHIVNRTGLVLGVIAIIATLFVPPYNTKRFLYTLSICLFIILIFYFYLSDTPLMNDAVQSYLSREEYSEYSAATGGGRFNRWGDAFYQILTNPIGGLGYAMVGKINYAHNLWLDAGLRGGIIPFILLLIISFNIIKYTFSVLKKHILDFFESGYIIVLCIVMYAQAMTEPVIEGVYQFFLFMIFFYGCVTKLKDRIKLHNSH